RARVLRRRSRRRRGLRHGRPGQEMTDVGAGRILHAAPLVFRRPSAYRHRQRHWQRGRSAMTRRFIVLGAAMMFACAVQAQPPGITREMVMRQLPLEGAPLAIAGAYEAVMEPVAGSPRLAVYRPAKLDAFPKKDTLPVVAWGNGGCALDSTQFGGYLKTLASHGYVVVTTAAPQGADPPRATADDLRAAIDWSQAEATRSGSPLAGKIDKEHVAVMGVSCGGFLTVALASDPRVDTIGVFNSGVQAP